MESNKSKTNTSVISLLKKGDTGAFKTIFETYYQRLFAFAYKYVENRFAAEEIVENVLIILWQKRDKIDKIDSLKSYLYTMVRNSSIDFLKKEKKFERFDIEKHDSVTMMDRFIIEEETHAILFQALETLPLKCRRVFELSCLDGVKYKDIAEDLQISINTVKSQRNRAIQLLKQHLNGYPFFQILLATL